MSVVDKSLSNGRLLGCFSFSKVFVFTLVLVFGEAVNEGTNDVEEIEEEGRRKASIVGDKEKDERSRRARRKKYGSRNKKPTFCKDRY